MISGSCAQTMPFRQRGDVVFLASLRSGLSRSLCRLNLVAHPSQFRVPQFVQSFVGTTFAGNGSQVCKDVESCNGGLADIGNLEFIISVHGLRVHARISNYAISATRRCGISRWLSLRFQPASRRFVAEGLNQSPRRLDIVV